MHACVRVSSPLTESLGCLQSLGGRVGHVEALDGHATLLHQLLALVLLEVQPSPGAQPGTLGDEGEEERGAGEDGRKRLGVREVGRVRRLSQIGDLYAGCQ